MLLIPAALLMSGCSSGRLTAKGYRDELAKFYVNFLFDFRMVADVVVDSGDIWTVGDMTGFDKNCKNYLDTLRTLEKINPPIEYELKHQELVSYLDDLRSYTEVVKNYTECVSQKQFKAAVEELRTLSDTVITFLGQYLELMQELDVAVGLV